jgi:dipeptidyl aminopeptidase/acylaminoacyl peptidase
MSHMTRRFPKMLGLVSAAALLALPAMARPMEISDLSKISHASNLAVSPDGGTVAYTVSAPRDIVAGDEDGSADTHLYIKRGAVAPVKFIGGEGSVSGIQFSPDSQTLMFRSKRDGDKNTSLYSISLAGGEATKIFEHETNLGDYAVSPDGGTLYFVAKEKKDDKKALKDKGFKAYAYEEDLAMASVWTVALGEDDAKATALFEGMNATSIDLSEDGSTLVVAAAPTALIDDFYMKTRMQVLDAATGALRVEVETPGKLGGFDVSDDGSQIAFHAGTDISDTSDGVLMIADARTGAFTQLTADAEQHIMDVDWMSDGNILATVHRGVESALVVYDTAGEEVKTLPTSPNLVARDTVIGPEDAVYFTADSPAHPREVFSQRGNGVMKLSDNNPWLSEITLASQSTFTYTARDGRKVEGLLITPSGEKPASGWPLILTVHGGPEAHYSDGWLTAYSMAGQFGAGDGYAVFYPNYRGSTGRGVAFAKEHQNDYAGAEFNDLVDGVKALASTGTIDVDRVGITGGSYGGYAPMWGATALSEHFAASVAFVGISNQISKFGTSDIPNEMHLVHSLKWPWDDNDNHWMELLRRSPLFHVGQSTTPTLIMHGEEDTRVHPSQSMELYRSMKVRTDTPVRLVFYPGEGHGNRKAAAQMDYAHRLMRWMDTYLADGNSRDKAMPEFDLGLEEKLGMGDKTEEGDAAAE